MRTLHIIGINLQLRFGVHKRMIRQQQVVVGLLRIRLLGILVDDDPAPEDSPGMLIEHSLEQLSAITMGPYMFQCRVVVQVLPPLEQIQSVDSRQASLPIQHTPEIIASQPAAQINRKRSVVTVSILVNLVATDMEAVAAFIL